MKQDEIITYREMCDAENVQTLQRGMNYRLKPSYSVLLMSQRSNAPYIDRVYDDGVTIEYEGHDVNKAGYMHNPKLEDQPNSLPSGSLTQNGLFVQAAEQFKAGRRKPEVVKIYEKVASGIWSFKGYFDLIDSRFVHDGKRNVYRFVLKLSTDVSPAQDAELVVPQTRTIPTNVKQEVFKRDQGRCVICGSSENLHYDHELPYSRGGTSLSAKNVRLLCMKHNLQKSAKIE